MSQQTEHSFQKQLSNLLRAKGYYVIQTDVMSGLMFVGKNPNKRFSFINHHKAMGYTKGQPDLIAYKNKKTFFIEVKTDKGALSAEQKKAQDVLKDDYYIVKPSNVKDFLQKIS